jgi:isoleucyl-tRNA synthetase
LAANAGNPQWILHDGPPYANGEMHMGHFVNRVLKDVFVKVHLLDGAEAIFVPGWDMHGLPIEFETLRHLGLDFHRIDPIELRAKCRERALHWLDIQRETILRMGVLGDYEHPVPHDRQGVRSDDRRHAGRSRCREASSTRACARRCGASATKRHSPKPRSNIRTASRPRSTCASRRRRAAGRPLRRAGWAPRSTPAALDPHLDDDAVDAARQRCDRAQSPKRRTASIAAATSCCSSRMRWPDDVFARARDRRPNGSAVRAAPRSSARRCVIRSLDRDRSSSARTTSNSTPEPAPCTRRPVTARTTSTRDAIRFADPLPGRRDRALHEPKRGSTPGADLRGQRADHRRSCERAERLFARSDNSHSYPHCWRCKNPVIFRATAQWFIAMDVNRLRKRIEEKISSVQVVSGLGRAPHAADDRESSRVVRLASAHVGHADSGAHVQGLRGGVPRPRRRAQRRKRVFRERGREDGNASDLWWTEPVETFLPENSLPEVRRYGVRKRTQHRRHLVRVRRDASRGAAPARHALAGRPLLGRQRSVSRLVSQQSHHGRRDGGAPPYKAVVSTGWVVDADGRAMHKSTGNYIGAIDGMSSTAPTSCACGWRRSSSRPTCASARGCSKSIGSVYRNLRNRLRMLLGLISDFRRRTRPARATRADRPARARAARRSRAPRHRAHYKAYRLHDVYLELIEYDASDLSSFYVDVLKDPMYSGPRDGRAPQSAQTALFHDPRIALRAARAAALVHRGRGVAVRSRVAARPAARASST